jgi:hypothetical protein
MKMAYEFFEMYPWPFWVFVIFWLVMFGVAGILAIIEGRSKTEEPEKQKEGGES